MNQKEKNNINKSMEAISSLSLHFGIWLLSYIFVLAFSIVHIFDVIANCLFTPYVRIIPFSLLVSIIINIFFYYQVLNRLKNFEIKYKQNSTDKRGKKG